MADKTLLQAVLIEYPHQMVGAGAVAVLLGGEVMLLVAAIIEAAAGAVQAVEQGGGQGEALAVELGMGGGDVGCGHAAVAAEYGLAVALLYMAAVAAPD